MKRFLFRGSNKGEHRKEPKPAADDSEGKDDGFSDAGWLPHDLWRVGGL